MTTRYCPQCGGTVVTVRDGPVDVEEEICIEPDCSWRQSP